MDVKFDQRPFTVPRTIIDVLIKSKKKQDLV